MSPWIVFTFVASAGIEASPAHVPLDAGGMFDGGTAVEGGAVTATVVGATVTGGTVVAAGTAVVTGGAVVTGTAEVVEVPATVVGVTDVLVVAALEVDDAADRFSALLHAPRASSPTTAANRDADRPNGPDETGRFRRITRPFCTSPRAQRITSSARLRAGGRTARTGRCCRCGSS